MSTAIPASRVFSLTLHPFPHLTGLLSVISLLSSLEEIMQITHCQNFLTTVNDCHLSNAFLVSSSSITFFKFIISLLVVFSFDITLCKETSQVIFSALLFPPYISILLSFFCVAIAKTFSIINCTCFVMFPFFRLSPIKSGRKSWFTREASIRSWTDQLSQLLEEHFA